MAGFLTWYVVRIFPVEGAPLGLGVYGDFGPGASAQVSLQSTTAGVRWRVDYPPGTIWVGVPLGEPPHVLPSCHYTAVNGDAVSPEDAAAATGDPATFGYKNQNLAYYVIDVSTNPLVDLDRRARRTLPAPYVAAYGGLNLTVHSLKPATHSPKGSALAGSMECALDLRPFRETFTAKRYDVMFAHRVAYEGNAPIATVRFSATIDQGDAIQIFGGRSTSSNATDMAVGTIATVRYNDVRDESRRDVILIVIGSLIAIAAAMALEAIRPYVELWARGASKSSK